MGKTCSKGLNCLNNCVLAKRPGTTTFEQCREKPFLHNAKIMMQISDRAADQRLLFSYPLYFLNPKVCVRSGRKP